MESKQTMVSLRQEKIIEYLKINKSAKTDDLANLFNTSPITIRRDFKDLEQNGVILRYHGGAQLLNQQPSTSNFDETKKNLIAKYAASLIDDGDTIFINSSTTAINIIEYLDNKRITIITNNGKSILKNYSSKIDLILTGGVVYGRKASMTGDLALQVLSNITAQKSFIGVSGIHSELGISTSVLQETSINKEMIKRTNGPVYILATSEKIGIHHNFSSGEISDIDYLITDTNAPKEKIDELTQVGVNTILIEY